MGKRQTFYLIVVTQTLSLIGSRMTSIGVGLWLFQRTSVTTPLLLAAFFAELPGMLGGSLAGVLVDRWERRQVLILADAGQAVGTVLLLTSILSGQFQLWHLYLIVLFQGGFAILQQPAKDAATTMLVSETHRERANAIQQMGFPLAGVVAPVLTGLIYAGAGLSGIILIDLTTFLVVVVAVYLSHIPQPQATAEGLADRGHFGRELLALVLYRTFINFLLGGPLELAIPYLIQVTGSEAQTGGLMGMMSLGALARVGLRAVWGGTRPRLYTLLAGLLLSGLMFLLYGTARSTLGLGLSLFLLMIPLPMSSTLFISILQIKTPPDMQGRIFATVSQLGFLGATASFLLVGPLVDQLLEPQVGQPGWRWVEPLVGGQAGAGMGLLLVVTGIIILGTMLAMVGWLAFRRLELTPPDYEGLADQPVPGS